MTTETTRQASKQETFDTVVRALIKQGRPSAKRTASGTYACRYRWRGLKCAAGHLIPDKLYRPKMEGLPCEANEPPGRVLIDQGHDIDLALALQDAHDAPLNDGLPTDRWLAAWVSRMRSVAELHNLSDAVLDEATP